MLLIPTLRSSSRGLTVAVSVAVLLSGFGSGVAEERLAVKTADTGVKS